MGYIKVKTGPKVTLDFTNLVFTIKDISRDSQEVEVYLLHLHNVPTKILFDFFKSKRSRVIDVFCFFEEYGIEGTLQYDNIGPLPVDSGMIYELVGKQTCGNFFWVDSLELGLDRKIEDDDLVGF